MARREAMTEAAVPWPETAIHLARLRLLPRLVKAPCTLLALLQTPAADEWQQTMRNDLAAVQALLPSLLASLPDPKEEPVPCLRLASSFPRQWEQLMRRFAKALEADQEVTCMLGYKEIKDIQVAPYDSVEQPIKCPDCERFFPSRRGAIMHGKREHGTTAAAASLVANTRCHFLSKKIQEQEAHHPSPSLGCPQL